MNDEPTREFQMVSFVLAASIPGAPEDGSAIGGLEGEVNGGINPQCRGDLSDKTSGLNDDEAVDDKKGELR